MTSWCTYWARRYAQCLNRVALVARHGRGGGSGGGGSSNSRSDGNYEAAAVGAAAAAAAAGAAGAVAAQLVPTARASSCAAKLLEAMLVIIYCDRPVSCTALPAPAPWQWARPNHSCCNTLSQQVMCSCTCFLQAWWLSPASSCQHGARTTVRGWGEGVQGPASLTGGL